MKASIHPQWYPEATVGCACGNRFTVGSTKSEIHVDICSNCHPFYTGEMRYADTEGKVQKFQKKIDKAKALRPNLAKKKAKKKGEKPVADTGPKTLKEMLLGLQ